MKNAAQIAVLNIAIADSQFHTPESYVKLFTTTYKNRTSVKVRAEDVGMIGAFFSTIDGDAYEGYIYKYLELDLTSNWYNVTSRKQAVQSEVDQIHVPDDLKPHFHFLPFILYPSKHRLVYVCRDGKDTLSPGLAQGLFNRLFESPKIFNHFGKVSVTAHPSADALETMWKFQRLRELIISITPPNADDLHLSEQEVYQLMENQRAATYTTTFNSTDKMGLKPSPGVKKLAEVAQENGKVLAKGLNEQGLGEERSTEQHPFVAKYPYDGTLEPVESLLRRVGREILNRVLRRRAQ